MTRSWAASASVAPTTFGRIGSSAASRSSRHTRVTLAGPQRDLIDFLVDGRNAADVLSGGELKMIVLFLKFAKIELYRARQEQAPRLLEYVSYQPAAVEAGIR